MKKFFLLFYIFIFSSFLFGTEGYRLIGRPHFIPDNYYVGDEVICRLVLELDADFQLYLDPELKLPDRADLVIDNINIYPSIGNQSVVEIHFVPFYPQLRIPPLPLGDIVLDEIMVNTFSVLDEEGGGFASLRDQVYLPYTREIVLIFVFCILLVIIIFLFVSDKFRKLVFNKILFRRRINPYAKIDSVIKELDKAAGVISPKDFYIKLTKALRVYFSDISESDFISITTGEMKLGVMHIFNNTKMAQSVEEMMKFADEIKFSEKRVSQVYQRKDLLRLRKTVNLAEEIMAEIKANQKDEENKKRRKKRRR